mgnify:CR=1 FL=1
MNVMSQHALILYNHGSMSLDSLVMTYVFMHFLLASKNQVENVNYCQNVYEFVWSKHCGENIHFLVIVLIMFEVDVS